MKRLLSIIGIISLISTTSISIISCQVINHLDTEEIPWTDLKPAKPILPLSSLITETDYTNKGYPVQYDNSYWWNQQLYLKEMIGDTINLNGEQRSNLKAIYGSTIIRLPNEISEAELMYKNDDYSGTVKVKFRTLHHITSAVDKTNLGYVNEITDEVIIQKFKELNPRVLEGTDLSVRYIWELYTWHIVPRNYYFSIVPITIFKNPSIL